MISDSIDWPGKMLHQMREDANLATPCRCLQIAVVGRDTIIHQEAQNVKASALGSTFDGGVQSRIGIETAPSGGELVQYIVYFSSIDDLIKLRMRRFEESPNLLLM